MKILGIDTSTKFLCLGIYGNANPVKNTTCADKHSKISNGAKIYEYNLETGKRLSSLLAITIKRVLDTLNWRVNEIDYFACGLGPGSFTGIRIGLATIKGLAWSLNRPVIGISTLDILARNAKALDGYIVPMVDAKRGLIYCSIYKTKDGTLRRITPYMLLSEKEFFRKMKNRAILFADAVGLYKEKILRNIKGVTILDEDYWYPNGRNIIELALERIKDKKFDNSFKIKPIYLYPKECQISKTGS